MKWNNPWVIFIALVASAFVGSSQPLFGVYIFSPIMTQLTIEDEIYAMMFPGVEMKDEILFYTLMTGIVAVATFLSMFVQKFMFGRLSERVTWHIRNELYDEILSKNIGWFDLRDNSVGILSSSMAQDTSLINGVSAEGLGPICETIFALLVGMVIGFYYSWEMSVLMIVLCPFLIIGGAI